MTISHSQQDFFGTAASYAGKVWRGSTTSEPKFAPLSRRQVARLYHNARRFERTTRGAGRQDGAIGRNGQLVLHALLFDFLEPITGKLMPSYAQLARAANISISSVYRGLVKLKRAGVINWIRRCIGKTDGGRFVLEQETNAYGICSERAWKGYSGIAPPPAPETWGAAIAVPDALSAAAAAIKEGEGSAKVLAALDSEPGNPLAVAIARIMRVRSRK